MQSITQPSAVSPGFLLPTSANTLWNNRTAVKPPIEVEQQWTHSISQACLTPARMKYQQIICAERSSKTLPGHQLPDIESNHSEADNLQSSHVINMNNNATSPVSSTAVGAWGLPMQAQSGANNPIFSNFAPSWPSQRPPPLRVSASDSAAKELRQVKDDLALSCATINVHKVYHVSDCCYPGCYKPSLLCF